MKRKSCSSYQKYSSTINQIFNWIFKKDCWFYLKKIISQSWLFICIHCRLVLNPSNLAQVITGAHIAIRNLKRSSICSITLESIPVNNPSNVPTVQRNSRTNIIGPNIFEIFILMIHIKFKIEHHLLLCKREGFIEIVLMKYYQIFNKWLNVDNKKLLDLFKFLIKLGIYHILNTTLLLMSNFFIGCRSNLVQVTSDVLIVARNLPLDTTWEITCEFILANNPLPVLFAQKDSHKPAIAHLTSENIMLQNNT